MQIYSKKKTNKTIKASVLHVSFARRTATISDAAHKTTLLILICLGGSSNSRFQAPPFAALDQLCQGRGQYSLPSQNRKNKNRSQKLSACCRFFFRFNLHEIVGRFGFLNRRASNKHK